MTAAGEIESQISHFPVGFMLTWWTSGLGLVLPDAEVLNVRRGELQFQAENRLPNFQTAVIQVVWFRDTWRYVYKPLKRCLRVD